MTKVKMKKLWTKNANLMNHQKIQVAIKLLAVVLKVLKVLIKTKEKTKRRLIAK